MTLWIQAIYITDNNVTLFMQPKLVQAFAQQYREATSVILEFLNISPGQHISTLHPSYLNFQTLEMPQSIPFLVDTVNFCCPT